MRRPPSWLRWPLPRALRLSPLLFVPSAGGLPSAAEPAGLNLSLRAAPARSPGVYGLSSKYAKPDAAVALGALPRGARRPPRAPARGRL